MPIHTTFFAPLIALFLFFAGEFRYEFSPQTDGKGTAYIKVISDENLDGVKVEIKGDDGSVINKVIRVKANRPATVTWKQKNALVNYSLRIEAGDAYTEANFEVHKATAAGKGGNFKLVSGRDEIVKQHQIRYRTPFTVTSWNFKVFNTEGQAIIDRLGSDQYQAGSEITMKWDMPDDVFMVYFRGEDDLGRFAEDKTVPWSVNIPHTEVIFDSGKSEIKEGEAPKVDEAFAVLANELAGLERANEAVGANIKAKLYIVGYTDTVGRAGKNQTLSGQRARAIAEYFHRKGTWCEIWYAGMGEKGLAVQTDDNVDEARNRRALYLLDVQTPAGGGAIPSKGAWKKLADGRPRPISELPPLPDSYVKMKEEQRQKNGGGSVGMADESSSSDSGDSVLGGSEFAAASSGDEGSEGPPAVEGEPGASAKGCQVTVDAPKSSAWAALALLLIPAWFRRRA